jgi:hypothetical protein
MKSINQISISINLKKDNRNTHEFQAYGNRLAEELGDTSKRSLYIKLAKSTNRNMLESARLFAHGNPGNSKAKSFMWKLNELKNNSKVKKEEKNV